MCGFGFIHTTSLLVCCLFSSCQCLVCLTRTKCGETMSDRNKKNEENLIWNRHFIREFEQTPWHLYSSLRSDSDTASFLSFAQVKRQKSERTYSCVNQSNRIQLQSKWFSVADIVFEFYCDDWNNSHFLVNRQSLLYARPAGPPFNLYFDIFRPMTLNRSDWLVSLWKTFPFQKKYAGNMGNLRQEDEEFYEKKIIFE